MAPDTHSQAGGPDLHSDASGRRRQRLRWVARILMLAVPATALAYQGGAQPESVAAVAALLAVVWLFTLAARPHKNPSFIGGWLLVVLGGWTALQALPLPRGLTGLLTPQTLQLWDQGREALGLPQAALVAMALAPGDAALQACVYLLAGTVGVLTSTLFMGSQGRLWLRYVSLVLVLVPVLSGLAYLSDALLIPEGYLPASLRPRLELVRLINPNHVAAVCNLGLGIALGHSVHSRNVTQEILFGIAALLLASTAVATGSRGGIVVAGGTLLGTILASPTAPAYMRVNPRDRQATARLRSAVLGAIVLLVVVVLALPIIEREMAAPEQLAADPKLGLWMKALVVLPKVAVLGWGPGGVAIQLSQAVPSSVRFDFIENFLVDRLLASGLLVGLATVIALGWSTRRGLLRVATVLDGKTFAVAWCAFLVANLVDFSFEVLGPLVLFAMIGAAFGFAGVRTAAEAAQAERRVGSGHRRSMAVTGLALLGTAGLLQWRVAGGLNREIDPVLAKLPAQEAAEMVGARFATDEHALYVVARKWLDAKQTTKALKALDAAVKLRPAGAQLHLFRFAARLDAGQVEGAAEDLIWLFGADKATVQRALDVCVRSAKAEALLLEVMPKVPQRSYELALHFRDSRPDLVERVAVSLRKRYPGQVFGVEVMRAELYLQRGALEPAKAIAAALMANESTTDDGWRVQGNILLREGKAYEAHHVFKYLCGKTNELVTCRTAIEAARGMGRHQAALEYIRSVAPVFRVGPNWATIWNMHLGGALMAVGDYTEAVDALRNATGLDPRNLEAALLLAQALEHEMLFGELTELSNHLSEIFPTNPQVRALADHVAAASQTIPTPAARLGAGLPRAATPAVGLPAGVTKLRP
ncbi:MAG: hypothetical protein HY902_03630 [Deltaproteobacteria bacterium]|nr:hypothetical protein [Deltaproteobacteria bacterium]